MKLKQFAAGFFLCILTLGWVGVSDAVLKGSGGAVGNANVTGGTIDGAVIGGVTPAAGSFTTLAASSTVSGTGFSTYLASPPAIGGTTPAAGTFNPLTIGASGSQAILQGDAANTLAQRNGVNAQLFTSYNTFTDASNYERAEVGWNPGGLGANFVGLVTKSAGTGTARDLYLGTIGNTSIRFVINNAQVWRFATTGSLIANTDNAVDVGSAGATRPRTIYSATSFIGPLFRSDSAKVLLQGTGSGATQVATTQTTVPTVTTNGGTSPTCVGTDTAMTCTEGSSPPAAATFTVTFNGTWAAAPSCVAMRGTTGASPLVQGLVTSTTTVVVNLSANLVASEKYHIHCIGVS